MKVETYYDKSMELQIYKIETINGPKYFADSPFFKGCVGSGSTKDEAIAEAGKNKILRYVSNSTKQEMVDIASLR